MFKNRSKVLFIAAVLGSLYLLYLPTHFLGASSTNTQIEHIATSLIIVHMVLVVLATIFNWLAFAKSKKWAAIACSVLYCVAGLTFLLFITYVIPMIILSFMGLYRLLKIEKNVSNSG